MTYRFGTFEFDDQALELRKQGRFVSIEPQPARVLSRLLARAGDVVTRDELKLAVWGTDTHVDFDRGLAYCLSEIRRALGERGDNPRFVETLPRRGYRFVAPVAVVPAANGRTTSGGVDSLASTDAGEAREASPSPSPVRTTRPSRRTALAVGLTLFSGVAGGWWWVRARGDTPARPAVVAVSVFDNETGNPEHDRLVSRLSDAVVVRLTGLAPARLSVIGNAEVLRRPRNIRNLRAVAANVRADYVVLGQLQAVGRGWRFVTHLVRLPEETHLKANRLEVSEGDEVGLESAVVLEFEAAVRRHVVAP